MHHAAPHSRNRETFLRIWKEHDWERWLIFVDILPVDFPHLGLQLRADSSTRSKTARYGGSQRLHDVLSVGNYLFDLGRLVKECALAAVAEREKQRDQPAREFHEGYVLGFHPIVSLMQQQAQAFGIELKDLQLDGIEPDRDLA